MELGEAIFREVSATSNSVYPIIRTKVYPGVAPQGVNTPFITYQKVSEPINHAMSRDPNIREPRVQIGSYSTSFSQSRAMALAVMNTLRDFSTQQGLLGDATSGLKVQRCFFEFEIDLNHRDPETYEMTYHTAQDYIFWYSSS